MPNIGSSSVLKHIFDRICSSLQFTSVLSNLMEVTKDASVDDIAPVCDVLKGILAGQLGRFYKKLILDATEP